VKAEVIADIIRLLEEKATIAQTNPSSPAFVKWRQEALLALGKAFGPNSSYISVFNDIQFEVTPALIEKARRKLPKFIHGNGDVTKIFAAPLEQPKENRFKQALAEAADLLLCAKVELTRSKK
jgi:hypothetical protein